MENFDFNKLRLLLQINDVLKINNTKPIIVIYSAPKVGSTTLVSSLRIFGLHKFTILHIHDENTLKVLCNVDGITINELILYNALIGNKVYVIDVYRNPIERKISAFFEKIGAFHFNTTDEKINNYPVIKVIRRFNNIFPHISNGDHFMDKYNITLPDQFDFDKKYLIVKNNCVNYIKLRLIDSAQWGAILEEILGIKIGIVPDYQTANKPFKDLYLKFKNFYKIPENYLNDIMKLPCIQYYYSDEERNKYFNLWKAKSIPEYIPYTLEQYDIYCKISQENCVLDKIQTNHYIDEGCLCNLCSKQRMIVANNILNNNYRGGTIYHYNIIINNTANTFNKSKIGPLAQKKDNFMIHR